MIDIDLRFIGTLSDNELHRLLKKENNKELEERSKAYHAGKARQEELDEIDQCRLCEIMPELEKDLLCDSILSQTDEDGVRHSEAVNRQKITARWR